MTITTTEKLASMVAHGLGSGRCEGYQPWIRIRRKLSSPVSNLQSMVIPMYRHRSLQLLSGLESDAANVAMWLGATEIREQHPAWPHPHPHPAGGMHPEFDRMLGTVPGLLELAKGAGIDHGVYPGTKIPFVATLDFTIGVGPWYEGRIVQWSCKPRSLLDSAPNRARMHERIAMERLYSTAVLARHVVVDGTQFPKQLTENLDWLRPLRGEARQILKSERLRSYGASFMHVADNYSIVAAKRYAAGKNGLDAYSMEGYFRAAAWLGIIDIDMTRPIVMSEPLVRDLSGFKLRLSQELLGIEHEHA